MALPGPHEHLRRPRQHRGARAPLRAGAGSASRVTAAGPGEPLDPDAHDLLYIGGGQDRDQALVARDLVETKREAIAAALDARCRDARGLRRLPAARPLATSSPDGESLPGLGLVDLRTVREPGPRLIGNVVIEADLGGGPQRIAGFENHGGRTYLGADEQPLGRVVSGFGNNGKDGHEGVRRGRLIGTYLHGPLLPKNAWLADRLIEWALGAGLRRAAGARRRSTTASRTRAHDCAVRAALQPARRVA